MFFFVLETPLKDFPINSPILLNFWFRYLETHIKESCMYLSTQLFFKTPHKTLKLQEKKMHFPAIFSPKFQFFLFGVYHEAAPGAAELSKR